ncbi:Uu.00g102000.m01.CDS01 [Anthostomella pinea]|uniref:Uu.00g102000.m01.CDS01 n=1 Tax=Anthostomella pinea TaxID=933095 RepID=A0AAI8VD92_9PEZI|nr:Uu.00g102000.m01.CDS01 [Anthostomella pinea]
MFSKELLSAVAAISFVSGAAAVSCSDPTATVASAADATQVANCQTIKGSVLISTTAGPDINIGGELTEIGGDLVCENNGAIHSLQSSSLETIGGIFQLKNVTQLNSLSFPALGEVGSIDWATLNSLPEPTFGTPGITKAKSVTIADTFIETIDGINVESLTDMNINNNRRLTKFSSSIKSLSNALYIQANGLNLTMEMPNLEWIANMTIANVTSLTVPSLKTVNGSMRFDSNYFENFLAANLTQIQEGDLSFVSNPQLQNISFPVLEKVGGGLTIANNTALGKINGFGALQDVGGAVIFRGSMDDIELPKLENVVGTLVAISTEDLTDSCNTLNKLSGGVIQGTVTTCHGNDMDANNDTSSDTSGDGSSSSGDKKGAASFAGVSMPTIVSLAAFGTFFTAFL